MTDPRLKFALPPSSHPDPTVEEIEQEISDVQEIVQAIEALESFKFDNAPFSQFGDMVGPVQSYLEALEETLEDDSETLVHSSR